MNARMKGLSELDYWIVGLLDFWENELRHQSIYPSIQKSNNLAIHLR